MIFTYADRANGQISGEPVEVSRGSGGEGSALDVSSGTRRFYQPANAQLHDVSPPGQLLVTEQDAISASHL